MLTISIRKRSNPKYFQTPKIDELLESIGLIRHVVPRDGNSLFRCISQCVFLTQSCHMVVRQHLLQFANLQSNEFNQMTQISVSKYAKKITDSKMDGELLDMRIAAKLYKINVSFYVDAHPFMPLTIDTPNALKTLHICLNYEGTYDLVFVKESVVNISFCQSVMYGALYSHVFKLTNVDFAVNEMLFDRNLPSMRSNDPISLEKRATCTDMKELLEFGITPFPFKVAKALTPKLYRNTEYDIWLSNRKEKFYGKWNNWEFKEGSKCIVSIGNDDHYCYIQNIRGKNEPVEVYVKDLAQKIFVDFNQLKLITVEQDVRETLESPKEVDRIGPTIDDGNMLVYQGSEQNEIPFQLSSGFMHGPAIHGALSDQTYPSACYIHPYQQQPTNAMSLLNSQNKSNVMPPWFVPTFPPMLPNNFHPMKEQVLLMEPNYQMDDSIPLPNCVDTQSKVTGFHVQPMPPSWYCAHPPNMLCRCVQCGSGEESDVTMDSNHVYQSWQAPEFDVSAANCTH